MSAASELHASCRFEPGSKGVSDPALNCERGDGLYWEMLGIWAFVVFSFAALVFAGYLIWVKCDSP